MTDELLEKLRNRKDKYHEELLKIAIDYSFPETEERIDELVQQATNISEFIRNYQKDKDDK